MIAWLEGWWASFIGWLGQYWSDFVEFLQDLPKLVLDGVLGAIATVIEAIPVPSIAATNGLASVMGSLDPSIQYFLLQSGMVDGLAILGLGFTFRMTRKLVTLFQW